MEIKAKKIREELDELGYYQTFTPESTPLVEKLLADLKTTTESLQKYMKIAQSAIEERDNLQLGAEPYKCDNARLVKECNDLHLSLLQHKEHNEKIQRDLIRRLELFQAEISDCNIEKEKLKSRVRHLEAELIERGEILLHSKQRGKPTLRSSSSALTGNKSNKSKNFEINSAMALADQKIANLSKEIKKLKEQNLQLIESNEVLQCQLNNRDKEIRRLNGMLEGGRPLHAIKKDCCCNRELLTEGAGVLKDELNKVSKEKNVLESRLKEALAKQHEAMTRALHLAERNKLLEKEMKDIDNLALAVEAECNNTVKNNTEKVNRLQDRVHESVIQIQQLEKENSKLKQEKQAVMGELDTVVNEKRHLQNVLETSLEDKKRLQDKINNFTIIENDLNMEIDRLTRLSVEQKRRIAELENSSKTRKEATVEEEDEIILPPSPRLRQSPPYITAIPSNEKSPTKIKNKSKIKKKTSSKKTTRSGSPTILLPPSGIQVPTNTPHDVSTESGRCCNCCCQSCTSTKHLKELLEKELEYREEQANKCIESLRSEKEFYMKEYHKILEQLKNLPIRPSSNGQKDKVSEQLSQKLLEKEQLLADLQLENKMLSQEKFNLMSRLDSTRSTSDTTTDGPCLKANCKRTERERDLLRADLERLEEERDSLKLKLRGMSDNQINEQERLQKRLMEAEEQVHKLEQERRELVQSQGSRRTTITTLEEQCDTVKEQLRVAQNELSQQRALYTQLKTLHEQTDRSLSDTQSKLVQAEAALGAALDEVQKRDLDRGNISKEVEILKNDLQIMKSQLAQIEHEKDELLVSLDDKTERMAMLEREMKSKEKTISSLESTINELKKKLGMAMDESANQEHLLRNSQTELATLRQELDTVKKIKDSAIQENRRLQDDLSSVTCDCRDSRKELELYKRQVDDLKTQLQHYVAEIKRAEDLISNKEIERNELLDQFRSLSHEANILESNNHTLETEASQSKVQLSVALDHAADLERKLENKESIISSYEKQIADLTSQVASLEIQLRQFMTQYERSDVELQHLRDACVRLETECSKYKRQLREHDDQRLHVDRNVEHLRSERDVLQHTASRDRRTVENVERDLHDAKHETHELRMLNQDLQEEVQRLKIQIQELKDKLDYCFCDQKNRTTNSNKAKSNSARSSKAGSATNRSTKEESLLKHLENELTSKFDTENYSNVPCYCMGPSTAGREIVNGRDICLVEKCCDFEKGSNGNFPSVMKTAENNFNEKNDIKSCFILSGQPVKSLTANYTIVRDTYRVNTPTFGFKK